IPFDVLAVAAHGEAAGHGEDVDVWGDGCLIDFENHGASSSEASYWESGRCSETRKNIGCKRRRVNGGGRVVKAATTSKDAGLKPRRYIYTFSWRVAGSALQVR